MYKIMYLVITLAMSSASDVSVYKFDDYYEGEPGTELDPVALSSFPLKFLYHLDDWHFMRIHIKNQSPIGNAIQVKCHTDVGTFEAEMYTVLHGRREGDTYYWCSSLSLEHSTEIRINLNTTKILGSSLLLAVGKPVSNITNESTGKEYTYIDECKNDDCVLVVDLKNKCGDGKCTDSTVIIVLSLSGITFILVVIIIITIWKCCCIRRNPSGTPQLPTNTFTEPFYLNMLYRRDCDQEIAEIDQHHYEEIIPQGLGTERVPVGT